MNNYLCDEIFANWKSKSLKMYIPFPSKRIIAVFDVTRTLKTFEIFYKVKYPEFMWQCTYCNFENRKNVKKCNKCSKFKLRREDKNYEKQLYYIHEGPIGLLKNPCLHAASYRRAMAVRNKTLEQAYPGEALAFCSRDDAETALVHHLSGGDLDGDDFLCVCQPELLPLEHKYIEQITGKCVYDDQGKKKATKQISMDDCINFS
eukprot:UN25091